MKLLESSLGEHPVKIQGLSSSFTLAASNTHLTLSLPLTEVMVGKSQQYPRSLGIIQAYARPHVHTKPNVCQCVDRINTEMLDYLITSALAGSKEVNKMKQG